MRARWIGWMRGVTMLYSTSTRAWQDSTFGGARLRVLDVQKIAYYFSAISFALLSRLLHT